MGNVTWEKIKYREKWLRVLFITNPIRLVYDEEMYWLYVVTIDRSAVHNTYFAEKFNKLLIQKSEESLTKQHSGSELLYLKKYTDALISAGPTVQEFIWLARIFSFFFF
jgi:hypothetical protein